MSEEKEFSGSMTTIDGKRVALTSDQAKDLWQACETAQAKLVEKLPDTAACLSALCSAQSRLQQLGWRNGRYCPRDGSEFAVCEIGSTGMWKGFWTEDSSKSPISHGYIISADCVHRPGEVFVKPLDKLTEAERSHIEKCDADVAVMIDDMCRGLAAMQGDGAA